MALILLEQEIMLRKFLQLYQAASKMGLQVNEEKKIISYMTCEWDASNHLVGLYHRAVIPQMFLKIASIYSKLK